MSAQSHSERDPWGWLPGWLRPGADPPDGARGDRRIVESAIVIAIGALLAAATFGDLMRTVHINQRVKRDERTFTAYTHYKPYKYSVLPGTNSTTDIACAVTSHTTRIQLCLLVDGPRAAYIRHVAGGFSLPVRRRDQARYRYQCFGLALARRMCRAAGPLYAPAQSSAS
jgi:hypothetical protein